MRELTILRTVHLVSDTDLSVVTTQMLWTLLLWSPDRLVTQRWRRGPSEGVG